MNKFLLKSLVLFGISAAQLSTAQLFRTENRMDRLEGFDLQKFSWGFYLNGAIYDYKLVLHPRYGMNLNENLVSTSPSVGFGAGLIGKMRISDHFDLRLEPGLQFVQREIRFNTWYNDQYAAGTLTNPPFTPMQLTQEDAVRNVKSTLIDIPILIEIHGDRWYNTRPYAAGALNYIVNLQSNSKSLEDNLDGVFRSTTHNFAYSVEMGVQLYFRRFKLTPGIRGTFFMNNEMVQDNAGTPPYWAKAISTAQSRGFMLMLKFE